MEHDTDFRGPVSLWGDWPRKAVSVAYEPCILDLPLILSQAVTLEQPSTRHRSLVLRTDSKG